MRQVEEVVVPLLDQLFIPMRGYELQSCVMAWSGDMVIYPHEGL